MNLGAKVPLGLKRNSLRVVVTSGADRLMARGKNVIIVNDFFTGRKVNVLHHFGNPRFEHDVVKPLLLEVDDEGKRTAETLTMGANVEIWSA